MKLDIEKRLEYVRSQREILQRTEEELQNQGRVSFKLNFPPNPLDEYILIKT